MALSRGENFVSSNYSYVFGINKSRILGLFQNVGITQENAYSKNLIPLSTVPNT
jgi:hypothetical protein